MKKSTVIWPAVCAFVACTALCWNAGDARAQLTSPTGYISLEAPHAQIGLYLIQKGSHIPLGGIQAPDSVLVSNSTKLYDESPVKLCASAVTNYPVQTLAATLNGRATSKWTGASKRYGDNFLYHGCATKAASNSLANPVIGPQTLAVAFFVKANGKSVKAGSASAQFAFVLSAAPVASRAPMQGNGSANNQIAVTTLGNAAVEQPFITPTLDYNPAFDMFGNPRRSAAGRGLRYFRVQPARVYVYQ